MPPVPTIERIVQRLDKRFPLEEPDRTALLALPVTYRTMEPASYLLREGQKPEFCMMLLDGFAYRHKVTRSGDRQILSVHMRGEFLDLQNSFLEIADHNVQALTRVELAMVAVTDLRALAADRPNIARAMWIDTLIDAAIFREWIVNVGRRDSVTRISHLLCELALRLRGAGLGDEHSYTLPMTQEQIADCTGLTPVHVNRVLQDLGRRGLIRRDKRAVAIVDWERLREIGDFSSSYLHIERGGHGDEDQARRLRIENRRKKLSGFNPGKSRAS